MQNFEFLGEISFASNWLKSAQINGSSFVHIFKGFNQVKVHWHWHLLEVQSLPLPRPTRTRLIVVSSSDYHSRQNLEYNLISSIYLVSLAYRGTLAPSKARLCCGYSANVYIYTLFHTCGSMPPMDSLVKNHCNCPLDRFLMTITNAQP